MFAKSSSTASAACTSACAVPLNPWAAAAVLAASYLRSAASYAACLVSTSSCAISLAAGVLAVRKYDSACTNSRRASRRFSLAAITSSVSPLESRRWPSTMRSRICSSVRPSVASLYWASKVVLRFVPSLAASNLPLSVTKLIAFADSGSRSDARSLIAPAWRGGFCEPCLVSSAAPRNWPGA